jgi:hypothetical protein
MNAVVLAAISGETLLAAFVWLVIGGLIYWIADWGLKKIGLPEPFAKIATVLLVLIVLAVVINALLTLVGKPFIHWG